MLGSDGAPAGSLGYRGLVMAASVVVIVAGLKAASAVLLPVLVAAFLAVLSIPPTRWLQRRGLPGWLAVLIVFSAVFVGFVALSFFVGASIADFTRNVPRYRDNLREQVDALLPLLERLGLDLSYEEALARIDFGKVMVLFGDALGALSGMLSNTLFVLLTVAFMLGEAAGFPEKLRAALDDPQADLSRYTEVLDDLQGYLAIKTLVSVATGALVAALLAATGVDYALLWGLVAFLLNYVPNLGSILAALPSSLLALLQHGWQRALLVVLGYVVINVVIGNVVEPRLMGRRLGLSTLVVFLSLVFWGWIWGPVGMVLCVPLTMILKILLMNSREFRWLGILLSSRSDSQLRCCQQGGGD